MFSCCYVCPSARCGDFISPALTASSIWKSFLNISDARENAKLAGSRASLIFQKISLNAVG